MLLIGLQNKPQKKYLVLAHDDMYFCPKWDVVFFNELKNRLPGNVDINKTNMWHKASKKFYDVAHTPEILDYVEDLLGPNFYLWGGQFFYKAAFSKSIVPWHQDSQYWH